MVVFDRNHTEQHPHVICLKLHLSSNNATLKRSDRLALLKLRMHLEVYGHKCSTDQIDPGLNSLTKLPIPADSTT